MLTLPDINPQQIVLVPAEGDQPEVGVEMAPATRSMRRRAAAAARKLLIGPGAAAAIELARALNSRPEGEAAPDEEKLKAMEETADDPLLLLADVGDETAMEMIRLGIRRWWGVGDAEGNPADLTPANVERFLAIDKIFEKLNEEWVKPWVEREREKNGSSVSPSGTGEAETPESDTATSSAASGPQKGEPTAPAQGDAAQAAPTSRKPRAASKAKKSGS